MSKLIMPVVLVGAGPQGIGHARSWSRAGGKVAAVVDADIGRAQSVGRLLGAEAHSSLGEALAHAPRPCIVDIVTPPDTHLSLMLEALAAGAHILVEKPVVLDPQHLETLRAAHRPGLLVCAMHNWLYEPPMRQALERWRQGLMGDLVHVNIAIINSPHEAMLSRRDHWVHALKGGRVEETLPHACYLLAYLVPSIAVQAARLSKLVPYDWSPYDTLAAYFASGPTTASLHITFAGANESILVDLVGTRGQCRVYLLEGFVEQHYVQPRKGGPTKFGRLRALLGQTSDRLSIVPKVAGQLLMGTWTPGHLWIMRSMVRSALYGTTPPNTLEDIERAVKLTATVVKRALGSR